VSIISHFSAALSAAVERCERQVEVDVNLPWALFDLGIFHLYLGRPDQGLSAYAKGICSASEAWMIGSARSTLRDLLQHGIRLNGIEHAVSLLGLGHWVRADARERRQAGLKLRRGPVRFGSPLLIVAGGCANMESTFAGALEQLRSALGQHRGTIVSGGTHSGIADMVGQLQEHRGRKVRTIGYVPRPTAKGLRGQLDDRYTSHRHTTGDDFSVLEPLTFWEDFLAQGGDPAKVRLIGFNGGRIAGAEYRIALTLGAHVGIVQNSGRAADELLSDPLWRTTPNLKRLALTDAEVRAFLAQG
jgi:hypothetical protein